MPLAAARERLPGCSFCIITDGRRPSLLDEELASIHALGLPAYEIIVVGNITRALPGATVIAAPELAHAGRLGAMRNRACAAARFARLVVADDDMRFHGDFAAALARLDRAADVVCVRLLNPDGTRYWDWATHGGPRGHVLLDYHEQDEHVYVTGGLAIMRADVHDRVQWDDARGFYAGEDLDWSARLRAAGVRIAMCTDATVTHQDARYTQLGRQLRFRQDLSLPERIATNVEGTGFFRPLDAGFRWMSTEGTLVTAPGAAPGSSLQLAITSLAPALQAAPLRVQMHVDDATVGYFTLSGTQTSRAALPIPVGRPLRVRLTSERTVSGREVGLDDERPVSVLLHDVAVTPGTPT